MWIRCVCKKINFYREIKSIYDWAEECLEWLGIRNEDILSDGEVALSDCLTVCWQTAMSTEVFTD